MTKLSACIVIFGTLVPAIAAADEAGAPMDVWTGKGQFGALASQGNSVAKSLNAVLDMARVDGPWKHTFHLEALYGESADIVSAERWGTAWQSNYDFSSNLFGFGGLRYEHDMFNGFQYQASGTAGVGYKLIDSDATKLSAQLGAGYRKSRPELLLKDAGGAVVGRELQDSDGDAIATAGVNYSQKLTITTTLTNALLVESGSSDTLITDSLALAVKVTDKLALSIGYNLQDNTKPPAGLKKLDTVETLNLVFSF